MVEGLADAAEESHVSFRILETLRDGLLEFMGCDVMRAGKTDKQSAFHEEAGGAGVEVAVSAQGFVHFGAGLCEGWRVEDDEVLFSAAV